MPSFFKVQKIKPFEFKPRYYSESKERIRNLQNKYHASEEDRDSAVRTEILRGQFHRMREKRLQARVGLRRTLILLVILCGLLYFFYS